MKIKPETIPIVATLMLFASDVIAQNPRANRRVNPDRPATENRRGNGDNRDRPTNTNPTPRPDEAVRIGNLRIDLPPTFRSIDGTGNNAANPAWGSGNSTLLRLAPMASETEIAQRPGARAISNACAASSGPKPNSLGLTDFVWQWGQFIDHDIDLSPVIDPPESMDIPVPLGDVWFDPFATGIASIPLERSLYELDGAGQRQQINEITAYIDASNVYGSTEDLALELRTMDGTGRLKTSEGNLIPFNENGFANAPSDSPVFFLAGDFRANEQVGLTAMHTLFVREHNHWADRLRDENPAMPGETVYQTARLIVGAELQAITYNEFLPAILGPEALPTWNGYRSSVDPGIANEFSTAAYRFGHSMLSTHLLRLDSNGNEIFSGHLSLAGAFFNPNAVTEDGIEPILRGLAAQIAQEIDNEVIDDVRNFLFGPPGAGGFDLASLNIQRGRDHALAGFNNLRTAYGLRPFRDFSDIHPDPSVQANLRSVYGEVDEIDAWVGGLAEAHLPGAIVGETWHAVISDQFRRLRDGDRFFYRNLMSGETIDMIERQTLAVIIRRNTDIGNELPEDVFRAPLPVEPFTIVNISMDSGHQTMTLTWTSQPNASYRIEQSEDMRRWTNATPTVPSEGLRTSATIADNGEFRGQCFRIRRQE